ncbi:nitrilotriacetate monooxygenase [Methylovirgula ligni]|uniref:Alkanesulfonate monooxygenase n=1 Tax=Methylovirgula ligni TaxID=569860 RepID=A0A3D9YRD5_9HYPH|nr:LLM class flavin-dependent oxidoreductase [Methylovirgula ligni]QAY96622.1 nitrilotriacetate monooxygenase [Methylovirgula ligni]REF84063.1 alkanesulfonate monooxygenase [Methylovirgula ligni]
MSSHESQLHLGVFLRGVGHHLASWRSPLVTSGSEISFTHYRHLARTAERGKFDMVFLGDSVCVRERPEGVKREILQRLGHLVHFEPLTLLSALSTATTHVGLVGTASTTYNEPYHVARKFASLDHISDGRAGWNVVTSTSLAEANNFNREEHLGHAERYVRANEFVDVVVGLWDSWDDDAFVADKAEGIYFDEDKVFEINHRGAHFNVKGPLNLSRPPQGHPVIVQAGSSDAGKDLAARTAEVVFTAQRTLKEGQAFYRSLKDRMSKYGRAPDELKIMPGVFTVVGRTQEEADDKYGHLQELVDPKVGVAMLSRTTGIDLSAYPLDAPLPRFGGNNVQQARPELIDALAEREHLTIWQTILAIAGARGHHVLIGTPERIADELEERFKGEAADGFNLMPPYLPGGLEDFVDLVVPELQRRGLFRTEYQGSTLRDHLGLARPANVNKVRADARAQA